VIVEVLHKPRSVIIICVRKARNNRAGAGGQEDPYKVLNAFFALALPARGSAGGQRDQISNKPQVGDFA
jgi:hypothetical protein